LADVHTDDILTRVSEGQGHTILIVDDDPINVSILQDLLHSANYETLVGGKGCCDCSIFYAPVYLVKKGVLAHLSMGGQQQATCVLLIYDF